MKDDRNYFLARAAQERSAADKTKGKARAAHQEMASRYDLQAQAAESLGQVDPEPVQDAPRPIG